MFAIPFGNFLLRTQLLWQALHRWWANHAGRKGRTLETAVSITAALLLGGAACATLAGADDNFARLWGHLGSWLGQLFGQDALLANLLIFALSLPVGAWLFGLAGGSAPAAPPVAAEQFYGKLATLPRLPQLMGVLVMAVLWVCIRCLPCRRRNSPLPLGHRCPLTAPGCRRVCGERFLGVLPHSGAGPYCAGGTALFGGAAGYPKGLIPRVGRGAAGLVPGLRCWLRPSWRCISICTAQRCGAFGLRGCWEHCYWPVFWLRCGCSAASRRHAWPLWQRRSASACCAACLWSACVWMLSWPALIAIGSFCSAIPGRAAS